MSKKLSNEGPMLFADLDLDRLVPLPHQCRSSFEGPEFEELVESVKHFGVLQPILVRGKPDLKFEVIYGGRRVAAARKAGLKKVPANIRMLSDEAAYEINFTENLQRQDLSALEKGRMLDFLMKKFGYSQEQVGEKFGKTQGWVSQHLAMLQIPESITRVIKHGEFTEKQAREILAAPEEKQREIIDKINETGEVPSAQKLREIVHPEAKTSDLTEGKVREILDTDKGKEVLTAILKEKGIPTKSFSELQKDAAEKATKVTGLLADEIQTTDDEKDSLAHETPSEEGITEVSDAEVQPTPKHAGSQPVLEVNCPDCHKLLIVHHLANGNHTVTVGKEE
jgi:ParB/RepB/Spo0J family partition protein